MCYMCLAHCLDQAFFVEFVIIIIIILSYNIIIIYVYVCLCYVVGCGYYVIFGLTFLGLFYFFFEKLFF